MLLLRSAAQQLRPATAAGAAAAPPPAPVIRRRRWRCVAALGGSGDDAASPSSSAPAAAAAAVSPFAAAAAAATAALERPPPPLAAEQGLTRHSWGWRGHTVSYVTAGCGRPVVLVHGFGASALHYRKTLPALAAAGCKVYAIDLLGFGQSDKPALQYSIELWAELLADFVAEHTGGGDVTGSSSDGGSSRQQQQRDPVLVGNSIGSLCVLAAAALLADRRREGVAAGGGNGGGSSAPQLAGIVLLNSAAAMNNRGTIADEDGVLDWRIVLAMPLLLLVDALLKTRPIAERLFAALAQPDTIRSVLQGVYVAPVDDELVDILLRPAFTPGALDVFVSVITGPAGPKPWTLLPRIGDDGPPMLVAWGDTDPFTPLDGVSGKYCLKLSRQRPNTSFALLEGVGHCPQDDDPDGEGKLHGVLLPWLARLGGGGGGGSCEEQGMGQVTAAAAAAAVVEASS